MYPCCSILLTSKNSTLNDLIPFFFKQLRIHTLKYQETVEFENCINYKLINTLYRIYKLCNYY